MFFDERVLAIIPARGGSKGLPRKNILETNSRPLISWTIQQAKRSKYIDKVIVSTDDESIAKISMDEGADVPFLRPARLATDTAKTIDTVKHLVDKLNEAGEIYDVIVLLEPTSPLRKKDDIDLTIDALRRGGNFDGAVTLGRFKTHPDLAKTVEGNKVVQQTLSVNQSRRQDLKELYFPFGVAYVIKTSLFVKELTFYPKELGYHIIEDWQCYEVDDYWDWVCIEAIMEKIDEFK